MTDFVVHPDGTMEYPPTGGYTMGPEEFANADTQQAWSVPPQPQPYYHESPYQEPPPHQDWAGVVKLVGGIVAAGVVIVAVIVLVILLTRPTPTAATQTVTRPPAPPSPAIVPTLPPGDFWGLPTPMSHPTCNGGGIVVLGNVTTPGMYAAGIQNLLNAHPGASYLRTDQACPSLRQASDEGTPIYAVFKFAGTTQLEVCTAVRAAGGGAYGKLLDYSTDPAYIIPCG